MPLDTVRILRVHRSATVKQDVYRYDIDAETLTDPPWLKQFQTVNAWRASVCEQARIQNRPITIGSRQTKYGWEVITAELADTPQEAA